MVVGILAGLLIGAGAFFAGKTTSGGGIEIGTSKISTQTTKTSSNILSPTITKTIDIQTFTAREGSVITTKKEQAISQVPTVSPQFIITPAIAQGGAGIQPTGGGVDFQGIALIGAVGLGAYLLLKPKKK